MSVSVMEFKKNYLSEFIIFENIWLSKRDIISETLVFSPTFSRFQII